MEKSNNYSNSKKKRVVIFGKTGVGKSYLGNCLTGDKNFKEGKSIKSETLNIKEHSCKFGESGLETIFIDTPGFSDNRRGSPGLIIRNICRLERFFKEGVHIILFCLQAGKKPDGSDLGDLRTLIKLFGENIIPKIYVTFTRLDALTSDARDTFVEMIENEFLEMLAEHSIEFSNNNHILFSDTRKFDLFLNPFKKLLANAEPAVVEFQTLDPNNPLSYIKSDRVTKLLEETKSEIKNEIEKCEIELKKNLNDIRRKKVKGDLDTFKQSLKVYDFLLIDTVLDPKKQLLNKITNEDYEYLLDLKKYLEGTDIDSDSIARDITESLLEINSEDKEENTRLSKENFIKLFNQKLPHYLLPRVITSLGKLLAKHEKSQNDLEKFNEDYFFISEGNRDKASLLVGGGASTAAAILSSNIALISYGGASFFSYGLPAGFALVEAAEVASATAAGVELGTMTTLGAIPVIGITLTSFAAVYLIYKASWSREKVIKEVTPKFQEELLKSIEFMSKVFYGYLITFNQICK